MALIAVSDRVRYSLDPGVAQKNQCVDKLCISIWILFLRGQIPSFVKTCNSFDLNRLGFGKSD